jgi:hypothetical protein
VEVAAAIGDDDPGHLPASGVLAIRQVVEVERLDGGDVERLARGDAVEVHVGVELLQELGRGVEDLAELLPSSTRSRGTDCSARS